MKCSKENYGEEKQINWWKSMFSDLKSEVNTDLEQPEYLPIRGFETHLCYKQLRLGAGRHGTGGRLKRMSSRVK